MVYFKKIISHKNWCKIKAKLKFVTFLTFCFLVTVFRLFLPHLLALHLDVDGAAAFNVSEDGAVEVDHHRPLSDLVRAEGEPDDHSAIRSQVRDAVKDNRKEQS